jgi:hypothetical protein
MKHENPIIIEFPFGICTYVLYVLPNNGIEIQNTNRNIGWQITFDAFITPPSGRFNAVNQGRSPQPAAGVNAAILPCSTKEQSIEII